jgi:hypothetical protein
MKGSVPRSSVNAGHGSTSVRRRSGQRSLVLVLGMALAMPVGVTLVGPVSPGSTSSRVEAWPRSADQRPEEWR